MIWRACSRAAREREWRRSSAERRSRLVGECDRGEQLIAAYFGAGPCDEHKATQAPVVVFDLDRDLLAWQAERVELPTRCAPS